MGLFDSIKSAVGGAIASLPPGTVSSVIEKAYPGGLQGVLNQLQQSGYSQQVNSWLGKGPNEPISPADLQNALNNDHVKEIAAKLGIPADTVLDTLSKALPEAVDHHSPNGQLEPPAA